APREMHAPQRSAFSRRFPSGAAVAASRRPMKNLLLLPLTALVFASVPAFADVVECSSSPDVTLAEFGGAISAASAVAVPDGWRKLVGKRAEKAFKKDIAEDGGSLYYRTRSGKTLSLEDEDYSALVRSGDILLLKDPKDSRGDPDDDTG